VQKHGKSFGPKAQPFIQRRAKPWYIGRTACYILLCLAVFGPTGQEFACLTNGTRGIEDELLARWAGRYREQKGIVVGPPYQGFALRWVNRRPFGAHIFRHDRGTETGTMN
jgi:hypothetical protein